MKRLLATVLFLGLCTALFAGDGEAAKTKAACCAAAGETTHECSVKAEPVKAAKKTKESCAQKACCKSKKAQKVKKDS
jgi:hypothetical protein